MTGGTLAKTIASWQAFWRGGVARFATAARQWFLLVFLPGILARTLIAKPVFY
jgi:hypothetical protein